MCDWRSLPGIFALAWCAFGVPARGENRAPVPPELTGKFAPPPELANDLGNYRSPLQFADGSVVQSVGDWTRRRAEILRAWQEVMGPWPALIERPRLEVIETTDRGDFTQRRVEVEIAPGEMAKGYLLIPRGTPKFPAVLVPFYEPETSVGLGKPLRDFGAQLARRGFVAMAIGSPGGDARLPAIGGARCQPLSYLAYVAANCANALANLPEVDAARIGVVGHSYGGKWAMFASCLYERFACAVWSDPGIVFDEQRANVNYWDPWYLGAQDGPPRPVGLRDVNHPRTGAYKILRERGMDLHELHALMAPRPFLVSGGAEDQPSRWVALNHAIAVNRVLGYSDRVAMTNRSGHEPTEESNAQMCRFFEHFLGAADLGAASRPASK